MKKFITGAASAAVLISASVASAQTDAYIKIDGVEGEASARSELGVTAQPNATSSAKGNVEVNWKVEEGEKAEEADTGTHVGGGGGGAGKVQMNTSASMRGGISVAAGDVNGLTAEEKATFLTAVKTHAQVRSGQDLENFAKGVLVAHESIENVSLEEKKIVVAQRTQAKFLGFFPISYVQEVEVETAAETSERVKVRFPWFAFLLSGKVTADELAAELGDNDTWVRGNVTVEADIAEVLDTVVSFLEMKHSAALSATASVQ